MKWIKLRDRKPVPEIDGEKVLIYRITNESQRSMSMDITDTKLLRYSNEDETWWMSLPEEPRR